MRTSLGLGGHSTEAMAAALAGAVSFVAVGALLTLLDTTVLHLLVGAACLAAVPYVARRWGLAYAAPAAIAFLVAFDWYVLPPTRPFGVPRVTDAATLVVYVAVGVLIGQLAARAHDRALASEIGRTVLAGEQAALRRVATQVAQGEPPPAIFLAVAREVGELFRMDAARVVRYLSDEEVFEHPGWHRAGHPEPPSGPAPLEDFSLAAAVRRTGRAVLVTDYAAAVPEGSVGHRLGIRAGMAAPIVVDGALWGAVAGWWCSRDTPPSDIDVRLAGFTELVATAIANAASHEEQARLAEEQEALRRVATLVASEPPSREVFAAVAGELGRLLTIDSAVIYRFEHDGTATVVAVWGAGAADVLPVDKNVPLDGDHVAGRVKRSGRVMRIDDMTQASGDLGRIVRRLGMRSAVGAPIVVGSRVWGAIVAATHGPDPLPPTTETRVTEFTELVATAIANVAARAEVAQSRARIVAAADAERRRVVRDLHDGAQQRLVHTVITLNLARNELEDGRAAELVDEALDNAQRANRELRRLAHGILPAALTSGGLPAAVTGLASQMPLPVELRVDVGRLAPAVEATAYFLVAEALTNVTKHAAAGRAEVTARLDDDGLLLAVRDDGVGGARLDGSGLVGLADRVAALHGRLRVDSPEGGGTVVTARIPLDGQRPPAAQRAGRRGA